MRNQESEAALAARPLRRHGMTRPIFIDDQGVPLYQCRRCCEWKPRDQFHRLPNPASLCGISSWCKRCDHAARKLRRRSSREPLTHAMEGFNHDQPE